MKHMLAVIGYGGMGSWQCQNVAEKIPQVQVKGAWDIREEAREKAKEKGLYAYSSLEELLQDEEVDMVTIAVPNNFHKELAIACLRAGKNVVCEKPVTMNAGELEEIMAELGEKNQGSVYLATLYSEMELKIKRKQRMEVLRWEVKR